MSVSTTCSACKSFYKPAIKSFLQELLLVGGAVEKPLRWQGSSATYINVIQYKNIDKG